MGQLRRVLKAPFGRNGRRRVVVTGMAVIALNLPAIASAIPSVDAESASIARSQEAPTPGGTKSPPSSGGEVDAPERASTVAAPAKGERLRLHPPKPALALKDARASGPWVAGHAQRGKLPSVTGLSAHRGPVEGGVAITVEGERFSGVRQVTFGSVAAKSVQQLSGAKLRVVTPAHWPGSDTVRVRTKAGWSRATRAARYTFVAPPTAASSTYTPAASTTVLTQSEITSVTGGTTYEFPAPTTAAPWLVTLTPGVEGPGVGGGVLLRPGSPVFPSGLVGVVASRTTDGDGSVVLTVVPQTADVLTSQQVDVSTSVADQMSSAGRSASWNASAPDAARWVQPSGTRRKDDTTLTNSVNLGTFLLKDFNCGKAAGGADVTVDGSVSFELSDVKSHFQVNVGLGKAPALTVWVSYETTLAFDISATGEATCELPATFVNTHSKIFLIGTTGATIAFAPDLSFSVSAGGSVSVEHHSYHMTGIASEDGITKRINASSANGPNIAGAVSLSAEVYGGVRAQVGLLNMVGVGISAGGGLRGSVELQSSERQVCASLRPFVRATLYAFVNLWFKEWRLDGFSTTLDLPQFPERCWPFLGGSDPSPGDYMGQILRATDTGASYFIGTDLQRHWIPNGGTYLCLTNWNGVAVRNAFTQAQIESIPAGADKSCAITQAFDTMLRVGATGKSYYVDTGGTKHWIPNGGTYLCLRIWKGKALYDNLSQADVDAFADGANATCQATETYDTIVRVGATGRSYYVDGSGYKHWIPNGGTFDCLYLWKGKALWNNLSQDAVDALPTSATNASCVVSEAFDTIVRVGATGVSYYVDGSGYKHWIPNGGTYNCLYYWKNKAVYYDLPQAYVDAIPTSDDHASCTADEAFDHIIRVGATGVSYYVDTGGTKHWIPNGGTFNCLYYWKGKWLYNDLLQGHVDTFPTGGNQSCTANEAFDTIVRVGATGVSYYVDTGGTKHWIPNGGTFNCLYYWKGKAAYMDLLQGHVDTFATGGDQSCAVTEARNTIVREGATGKAYFVDGNIVRHWIQDGATYNCLVKQGYGVYHDLVWGAISAIAEGSWQPKSSC